MEFCSSRTPESHAINWRTNLTSGLYTPREDMDILHSAAADLEQYLLSQVLYWPVEGGSRARGQAPSLTPGNLLLAQTRLGAIILPQEKAEEVARLNAKVAETRQRWASAWGRKAVQEFSARLDLWNNAVQEIAANPAGAARLYSQDVRGRVLLELLVTENGAKLLEPADLKLRAVSHSGQFVWPLDLQVAFPSFRFWFLYLSFSR